MELFSRDNSSGTDYLLPGPGPPPRGPTDIARSRPPVRAGQVARPLPRCADMTHRTKAPLPSPLTSFEEGVSMGETIRDSKPVVDLGVLDRATNSERLQRGLLFLLDLEELVQLRDLEYL